MGEGSEIHPKNHQKETCLIEALSPTHPGGQADLVSLRGKHVFFVDTAADLIRQSRRLGVAVMPSLDGTPFAVMVAKEVLGQPCFTSCVFRGPSGPASHFSSGDRH